MINNPDLQKSKIKPYLHQLSLECIEEIAVFMEGITKDEMDCDTCLIMQEILIDEIEDEEFLNFAIDNFCELLSYIAKGNLNIRIHRYSLLLLEIYGRNRIRFILSTPVHRMINKREIALN